MKNKEFQLQYFFALLCQAGIIADAEEMCTGHLQCVSLLDKMTQFRQALHVMTKRKLWKEQGSEFKAHVEQLEENFTKLLDDEDNENEGDM